MNLSILYLLIFIIFFVLLHSTKIFPGENSDSGFINIKNGAIYYLLFRSRHNSTAYPLVIWINGGPGSSSFLGAFYENGPYLFYESDPFNLKYNKYSWNENGNILFVEQPVSVGFSTAKQIPWTQLRATEDLYEFIIGFFEKYEEFRYRDFFITGESYSGHYIPSIANYILEHPHDYINLKGIGIGNGVINVYDQFPSYAKFAYDHKMISKFTYDITYYGFQFCQFLIKHQFYLFAFAECQYFYSLILGGFFSFKYNIYDVRRNQKYYQPGTEYLLADNENRKEMNVTKEFYKDFSLILFPILMYNDYFTNYAEVIAKILSKNVNVMIYSGEYDYLCNWIGAEEWAKNMDWSGKSTYNSEKYKDWYYNGNVFANYKLVNNFAVVKIINSGHMVPMDQPEPALFLFRSFIFWDIGNSNQKNYTNS